MKRKSSFYISVFKKVEELYPVSYRALPSVGDLFDDWLTTPFQHETDPSSDLRFRLLFLI
jgi:hypothetical protein